MIQTFTITPTIKATAYNIALKRDTVAKNHNRTDGKFCEEYSDLEVNWQGAIAEVILKQKYPFFIDAQDPVVYSTDTMQTDFVCDELRLEVKCNRFSKMHPVFFVNQALYHKKGHLFDKLICCGINNTPKDASEFYLFGWINKIEIPKFPLETGFNAPAYAVPLDKIERF